MVPLTVGSGSVTPATITFTSSTPDGTQTNSTTKVSFTRSRALPRAFHVYAKAGAANFTGCNTPPTSSVTVACGSRQRRHLRGFGGIEQHRQRYDRWQPEVEINNGQFLT